MACISLRASELTGLTCGDLPLGTDAHVNCVCKGLHALSVFDAKWDQRLPVIGRAWRDAWEHVTPFMAFPDEVRRVVSTTNAIEALNRRQRSAIKAEGRFPTRTSRAR